LINKGFMQPPPTYTVSGNITGSVQNGVSVELRENVSDNLVGTVTSNASGNYQFTLVPAGTYRVIPALSGHYFTPGAPVLTVSANTTQNFTSAVSTSSATTSATKVYVPQISATNRLRSVQKSPRALNTELYPGVTTNIYTPAYHNGRVFLPTQDGRVLVYDDNDVLRTTISPGIGGQIFAVYGVGNKLCMIGSTHVQFGTYTNGSPDVWTAGNKVANAIYPQDSTLFAGEVWITGLFSNSPTPHNCVRYNINTEAIVRSNIFAGANLLAIHAGDTTIAVQNTTAGNIRIIDPVTLNTVGAQILNIGANPNNIAFAQGKFWVTASGNLYAFTPSSVVAIPPGFAASGCVADTDYVYVFNSAQTGLVVVNASTNAVDGSTVSGLTSAAYYIQ
jgi:hypothetical protein